MNEQEKTEIANLFKSIPDEFRVIENKIKEKTINEYYETLDNLDNNTKAEILKSQNNWSDIKSTKETKELLVCLSEKGNVKSYRKIEEIIKNGNPEILDFSYVSLKFARLNLENQLSDEPVGFISSGLGGKENKLRYYFVIKSKEKIEPERESIVIHELENICTKNDSEYEESENHGKYVLIKILVSIDFAIGNIIDDLTNRCSFLDKEYMCTNVEKPSIDFIEKWINNKIDR
jgi:hypothetical protein